MVFGKVTEAVGMVMATDGVTVFVGAPVYIVPPTSPSPARPYLGRGRALAFAGIFVLSAGVGEAAQCNSNAPSTCTGTLYAGLLGSGRLLMIVGFALMLRTNKDRTAIIVYRPKPPPPRLQRAPPPGAR